MREFDLEAAKRGEEVQTRGGRPVRIVCFDVKDDVYVVLVLRDGGSYETIDKYTADGKYYANGVESAYDLFMKSKTVTKWYNLYKYGVSAYYGSKEEAEAEITLQPKSCEFLETLSITWED